MASDSSAPDQTFVELDEGTFNHLQAIRDRHGTTWRGMLIAGAIRLTNHSPLPEQPDLPPEIPLKSRHETENGPDEADDKTDDQAANTTADETGTGSGGSGS